MNEIFDGAFVRLPIGLVDRLVRHAGERMTAELRYTRTPDDLRGNPEAAVELLEAFVDTRPGTITLPFPSAEPGDLLVKQDRGEFWIFTVHGWRELAPLELQPAPFEPECGPGTPGDAARQEAERQIEHRLHMEEPHFGGGVKLGRASDHGAHGGVSGARQVSQPRPTPPLIRAADELSVLAGAIRRTIEVAERPDLGVDDRLRAFVEGLEAARRIMLEVAE